MDNKSEPSERASIELTVDQIDEVSGGKVSLGGWYGIANIKIAWGTVDGNNFNRVQAGGYHITNTTTSTAVAITLEPGRHERSSRCGRLR